MSTARMMHSDDPTALTFGRYLRAHRYGFHPLSDDRTLVRLSGDAPHVIHVEMATADVIDGHRKATAGEHYVWWDATRPDVEETKAMVEAVCLRLLNGRLLRGYVRFTVDENGEPVAP